MKCTPARLRTNAAWRKRNRAAMRELSRIQYERRREWYCWKERLKAMLMKIVRAEEARGRFE